jgi:hypothetical protein
VITVAEDRVEPGERSGVAIHRRSGFSERAPDPDGVDGDARCGAGLGR